MEKENKIEQRQCASYVKWTAIAAFTCFQMFFLWQYLDKTRGVNDVIVNPANEGGGMAGDFGTSSLRASMAAVATKAVTMTSNGLQQRACGLKGSDKFAPHQRYDHVYCDLFTPLQSIKNLRMLEIGFGCGHHEHGKSALVWTNFFADLQYFGVDFIPADHQMKGTEEKCVADFNKENPKNKVTKLWFGDQSNSSFLQAITSEYKAAYKQDKWDIIIDDGGHAGDQQLISFRELWPMVADGGYYVVEDLQYDGYRTFSKYAARWSRLLAGGDVNGRRKDGLYISLSDALTHKEGVNNVPPGAVSVTCAWQICVVRKSFGEADLVVSGEKNNFSW